MNPARHVLRLLVVALTVVTSARMVHADPIPPAELLEGSLGPTLTVLPPVENQPDPKRVALGKLLFFDGRLSGDATLSCAKCHVPEKSFADGLALSAGYPGTLYFRNTPSLLNVSLRKSVYWDGRLPASDLPTVVRDHVSEAHFLQADGRLVIERLRQVPEYERRFKEAFGGEPTYGRILTAVADYVSTLRSENIPYDRFLHGDDDALSIEAKRGHDLFLGRAGCVRCHNGALFSDGKFHVTGVPGNPKVFTEPLRHITFRRFFRTLGVPGYGDLRSDVGRFAITKRPADLGRFRTPSLREVSRTAPYMHDGSIETLADVVDFYDAGGSTPAIGTRDVDLKPLGLTDEEKADLVAFLESLSGDVPKVEVPELPKYELDARGSE